MKYLVYSLLILIFSCSSSKPKENINGRYRKEVDFILDAIREHSIDTLRGITTSQWNNGIAELYNEIDECKDDTSYYYTLRYFGALLKDAHFEVPNSGIFNRAGIFKPNDSIFPIWVKSWKDGRLFVVNDYKNTIPKHSEILLINGTSASEMVLKHRHINSGEEVYIQAWINETEEFDPRGSNTFTNYLFCEHINPPFKISYRQYGQEEIKTAILDGITRDERFKTFQELNPNGKALWDYKTLKPTIEYNKISNELAVLKINSFWSNKFLQMIVFGNDLAYPKLLKKAMAKIQDQNPKHLIIDIRGNGGGFAPNVGKTLAYFTDSVINVSDLLKINQHNRNDARILLRRMYKRSNATKKEINAALEIYDNMPDNSFFRTDTIFKVSTKTSSKYKFRNKVYLLTSSNVYSASINFANHFKEYNIGLIGGEPPGGFRQVTSGYSTNINLPYSDILSISIPYGLSIPPKWDSKYDFIKMDIPIKIKFEEWLVNEDSTLDTFISIILKDYN